ncbi:MAG TPA: AAA family ATPase [Rhizomicrobium sp.]|jgi:receptor protein-tyrosine kinase|nr:AAA family ATPase [Rhizomicrobium sp.]
MAEDRKSLNLIQRALDRQSGRDNSGPTDHIPAAPLRPAPVMDGLADNLAPLRPASANDGPAAEPETVQYTRLNMAVLRRSGMINPEVKTSTIANEFRNVKRKVLLAARDKKNRELVNNLIMVTSTLPEEGKTFTSVNLALSLAAERDVQVLLIDCDLHRPSVGKFFENSKQQPGMADLLTNSNAKITDVMRRCESVPNLNLIFAGKRVDDSPELIASTRMRDLLVEMSERRSDCIVVVDTPPALTTFEPAILAPHMHQAIMVVSAQHSGRHQIEKALDSISACHSISFLFNKAPKWEQKDGGYYYNYEAKPAAGA